MSNLIFYAIGFFTGAGLVGAVQHIRDLRAYHRAQVQAQLGAKLAVRHISEGHSTTVRLGIDGEPREVWVDDRPVSWPESLDLNDER